MVAVEGSPLAALPYTADLHSLLIKAAQDVDAAVLVGLQWDRLPAAQEAFEALLRLDRVAIDQTSACAAVRVLWQYVTMHTPKASAHNSWAFDVHPAVLARVAQVLTQFLKCTKRSVPVSGRAVLFASDLLPFVDTLLFPTAQQFHVLHEPEIALAHAIVSLAHEARRWTALQSDDIVVRHAEGNGQFINPDEMCTRDMDARVRSVCTIALLHSGRQPLPQWMHTPLWTSGSRRLETLRVLHYARIMKHCGGSLLPTEAAAVFTSFSLSLKLPEPRLCGPRIAGLGPPAPLPERQTETSATGLRIVRDHFPAAHVALSKWAAIALHVSPDAAVAALESWVECVRPLCGPSNSGPWTDGLTHVLADLCDRLAVIDSIARGEERETHSAFFSFVPLNSGYRSRIGAALWSLAELLVHGKNPFYVLSVLQAMRPLAYFWTGVISRALELASSALVPFSDAHRVLAGLGVLTAICPIIDLNGPSASNGSFTIECGINFGEARDMIVALMPMAVDRIECSETLQTVHALTLLECAARAGLVTEDVGLQAVSRVLAFARTQSCSGQPNAADAAVYNIAGQALTAFFETFSESASKIALDEICTVLVICPPDGAPGALATVLSRASAVLCGAVDRMLKPLLEACALDIAKAPAPLSGCVRECNSELYSRLQWRLCAVVGLVRLNQAVLSHAGLLWSFICGQGAMLRAEPCVRALGDIAKAVCRSSIDRFPVSSNYQNEHSADDHRACSVTQADHSSPGTPACIGKYSNGVNCVLQWNKMHPVDFGLESFVDSVRQGLKSPDSSRLAAACDLARYAVDCIVMQDLSTSDDSDSLGTPLIADVIALALNESAPTRTRVSAAHVARRAMEYRLCGKPGTAKSRLSLAIASTRRHTHDTHLASRLQMRRALAAHRAVAAVKARILSVRPCPEALSSICRLAFGPYAALREPAQSLIITAALQSSMMRFVNDLVLPLVRDASIYLKSTTNNSSAVTLSTPDQHLIPHSIISQLSICSTESDHSAETIGDAYTSVVPTEIHWRAVLGVVMESASQSPVHLAAIAKGVAHLACDHRVVWALTACPNLIATTLAFAAMLKSELHAAVPPNEGVSDILLHSADRIAASSYGICPLNIDTTLSNDWRKSSVLLLQSCGLQSWKALTYVLQFASAVIGAGMGIELCSWVLDCLAHDVAPVRSLAVYLSISILPHAAPTDALAALRAFMPWALLEGHAGHHSSLVFRTPIVALYRALGARVGSRNMLKTVMSFGAVANASAEMYRQRGLLEALVATMILSDGSDRGVVSNCGDAVPRAGSGIADSPRVCTDEITAVSSSISETVSMDEACDAIVALVAASVQSSESSRMWTAAGRHVSLFRDDLQPAIHRLLSTSQPGNGQRAQMLAFVRGICACGIATNEVGLNDLHSINQAVRVESASLQLCLVRMGRDPTLLDPWNTDGTINIPRAYSLLATLELASQDALSTRLDTWLPQALSLGVSLARLPHVSPFARRASQLACAAISNPDSALLIILSLLSGVADAPLSSVQAAIDCCIVAFARHAPVLAIYDGGYSAEDHSSDGKAACLTRNALNWAAGGHSGAERIAEASLDVICRADVSIECRGAVSTLLSAVLSSSSRLCTIYSSQVQSPSLPPDSAILVCTAVMLAHPYGVPPGLPAVLDRAAALVRTRPAPSAWLVSHVRRVFADFARTHADTWLAVDRAQFSEAQLDSISDLISAPSYYA